MGTQQPQLFHEVSAGPDEHQNDHSTRCNTDQLRKVSGTCFHCNKKRPQTIDCQTRKRELALDDTPHTESDEQWPQRTQNKPAQEKLVFHICGYTGDSSLTCR